MFVQHNRAFKEWAVVCDALQSGEQILLLRKGGIREEDGVLRMNDPEFFLMPTYEHQNRDLLQTRHQARLDASAAQAHDPRSVVLSAYAVADTIVTIDSESAIGALADEYMWNESYVRMRFDFNPYDPLYLLVLRVYNLVCPVTLPLLPEYTGCKSWVSLDRSISTLGAQPAIHDYSFFARRDAILRSIGITRQ